MKKIDKMVKMVQKVQILQKVQRKKKAVYWESFLLQLLQVQLELIW